MLQATSRPTFVFRPLTVPHRRPLRRRVMSKTPATLPLPIDPVKKQGRWLEDAGSVLMLGVAVLTMIGVTGWTAHTIYAEFTRYTALDLLRALGGF